MVPLFKRPTLSLIALLVSAPVEAGNVPDSFWENYCVSAPTLEEKEKWSCHMGTGAACEIVPTLQYEYTAEPWMIQFGMPAKYPVYLPVDYFQTRPMPDNATRVSSEPVLAIGAVDASGNPLKDDGLSDTDIVTVSKDPVYIPIAHIKPILNFPSGYLDEIVEKVDSSGQVVKVIKTARAQFEEDARHIWFDAFQAGDYWPAELKEHLIYLTYWVPSTDRIQTPGAQFEAGYVWVRYGNDSNGDPIYTYNLWSKDDLVRAQVSKLQSTSGGCQSFIPFAVHVVMDTEALVNSGQILDSDTIRAGAQAPGMIQEPYGIVNIDNSSLTPPIAPTPEEPYPSAYSESLVAHELGHAALNLMDEYIEEELGNVNDLNFVDPYLVLTDESGQQVPMPLHKINLSEILVANGTENSRNSNIPPPVSYRTADQIDYISRFRLQGAFWSAGVYRYDERISNFDRIVENLMDESQSPRLSPPQQRALNLAFGGDPFNGQAAPHPHLDPLYKFRANDRIQARSPENGGTTVGGITKLLLFDEDKNHHFHPTKNYRVYIQWYCPMISVGCPYFGWNHANYDVSPTKTLLVLDDQKFLLEQGGKIVDGFCSLINLIPLVKCESNGLTGIEQLLPTNKVLVPYQLVEFPTPVVGIPYYWTFSSNALFGTSSTEWSSFTRIQ
jgi:hypothetical protein